MAKKIVQKEIYGHDYIGTEFFEGTFNTVINNIQELESKLKQLNPEYTEFLFVIEYAYEGFYICVKGNRLETDEEYTARMDENEKQRRKYAKDKINKEKKERDLLEKLKAKYERNSN